MKRVPLKKFIEETDALTYINALKVTLIELKDEHGAIQETMEYQNQALERSRKLMRRIDNQYRAVVKCLQGYDQIAEDVQVDPEIEAIMEGERFGRE